MHTRYHFTVRHEFLAGALDRFAAFFVCPLFTESATEREMNAVDNEFRRNLQTDSRREYQLLKKSASPKHPMTKFGTGNLQTLRDAPRELGRDIRAELLAFHKEYYSADIMRLCVVGRESLDELETLVRDRFSTVPTAHRGRPVVGPSPWGEAELGRVFRSVPVKERRYLRLTWPLPPQPYPNEDRPTDLLGHLIGHEGKGSLLSLLKREGLALALGAGTSDNPDFAHFDVSIELTRDGLASVDTVAQHVYEYVEMLRRAGPQEWLFDETSRVRDIRFRFKEKSGVESTVKGLSRHLQAFDAEKVLIGGYVDRQWRPEAFAAALASLTPRNAIVRVIAPEFEGKTDQTCEWYGTPYSVTPASTEQLSAWTMMDSTELPAELSLPPENEMIAADFTLHSEPLDAAEAARLAGAPPGIDPTLLLSTDELTLWWHLDTRFRRPRTVFKAAVFSPVAYESPRSASETQLLMSILDEVATEYTYMAELAGMSMSVHSRRAGFIVQVAGYSEKVPLLLRRAVAFLLHGDAALEAEAAAPPGLSFSDDVFERKKAQLMRAYKNDAKLQPHYHASEAVDTLLSAPYWNAAQLLDALADVTPRDVRECHQRLLDSVSIECFAYGNCTEEHARRMAREFEAGVRSTASSSTSREHRTRSEVLQLPTALYNVIDTPPTNPEDVNSATTFVLQLGLHTPGLMVKAATLSRVMKTPFFSQLRTREQLGYLVWSGHYLVGDVIHFRLRVQSGSADAVHLHRRMEVFLSKFAAELRAMSAEEFNHKVAVLRSQVVQSDKTSGAEFNRTWSKISTERYDFDRANALAAEFSRLSHDDFVEWYDKWIAPNGPERRVAVARLTSAKHSASEHEPDTEASDETEEGDVPCVAASDLVPQEEALAAAAGAAEVAAPLHTAVTDAAAYRSAIAEFFPPPCGAMTIPDGEKSKL